MDLLSTVFINGDSVQPDPLEKKGVGEKARQL